MRDRILRGAMRAACTRLGERIVLVKALTMGLTAQATELNSKASREVNALYRYLANALEV